MHKGEVKTIGCYDTHNNIGSCGPPGTTDVCLTKSDLTNAAHNFICDSDSYDPDPPVKEMTERDFFRVACD